MQCGVISYLTIARLRVCVCTFICGVLGSSFVGLRIDIFIPLIHLKDWGADGPSARALLLGASCVGFAKKEGAKAFGV